MARHRHERLFLGSNSRSNSQSVPGRESGRSGRLAREKSRATPSLELLEDRVVLSNYSVTSNADGNTRGTLRYAISQLDKSGGASNTITFKLPAGHYSITPRSPLPSITKPVDIEGNSQPGFKGAPLVVISGGSAGHNASGLTLAAGSAGSVIQSLVIDGFKSSGIVIMSANDRVTGCYVGTDVTGQRAIGNNYDGVRVEAPGITIGGTTAGAANLISGNSSAGAYVRAP